MGRKKQLKQVTLDEIEKLLLETGLHRATVEEFNKLKHGGMQEDPDPRWKMEYRTYRYYNFFVFIYADERGLTFSWKVFGISSNPIMQIKVFQILNSFEFPDEEYHP